VIVQYSLIVTHRWMHVSERVYNLSNIVNFKIRIRMAWRLIVESTQRVRR
jgi:hypothetical protein